MKTFSNNMKLLGKLNLVVALPCEAKPIIQQFALKKMLSIKPFDVYVNPEKNIHLIISGVGKIKSAAATTFIQQLTNSDTYTCYCNIGIAGSGLLQLGELMVANKVIEQSTQRAWYPSTFYLPRGNRACLTTYEVAQRRYPEMGLVDMEAYGFYTAANLFVTQEQIQVVKIISDNNESLPNQIKSATVTKLIEDKMNQIALICNALLTLSQTEQNLLLPPQAFTAFKKNWHFSVYQQNQLQELLRRWQLWRVEQDPMEFCGQANTAKAVLTLLQDELEEMKGSTLESFL